MLLVLVMFCLFVCLCATLEAVNLAAEREKEKLSAVLEQASPQLWCVGSCERFSELGKR